MEGQAGFPAEGLLSWVIKGEQAFPRCEFGCGREGFLPGWRNVQVQWVEDPLFHLVDLL